VEADSVHSFLRELLSRDRDRACHRGVGQGPRPGLQTLAGASPSAL